MAPQFQLPQEIRGYELPYEVTVDTNELTQYDLRHVHAVKQEFQEAVDTGTITRSMSELAQAHVVLLQALREFVTSAEPGTFKGEGQALTPETLEEVKRFNRLVYDAYRQYMSCEPAERAGIFGVQRYEDDASRLRIFNRVIDSNISISQLISLLTDL